MYDFELIISVLGSENKKANRRRGETERKRNISGDEGVMTESAVKAHGVYSYFMISRSMFDFILQSKQQRWTWCK